ncbi:MAG: dTDP-glucose 4,6-dehydratase [Candidatus Melainabacteria bacterium]|nr:dTDP-glucose 4,6-dehydratase [Candidatus Melainabacteria bacterium]
MNVLVTGGCGFIGSWLVRHLLSTYAQVSVINLDKLTYAGNPDNLADLANHPRYRFVQGDIRDQGLVHQLMGDVSVCINAAAHTHVDRSITGPDIFISTNVIGTQVLLEAARLHQIEKFVQISTDEVYGSLGPTGRFTETSPIDPSSPYSASKAAADLIAMSYYRTYGLPVCITRCSNNYGPNQYPEKLIPFFILRANRGEKLPVYGDGLNVRDWIHVQDHSAAVAAVVDRGRPGEVYNVGSDNERTNLEITRLLMQQLQLAEDCIEYVTDRPGHDRRYAIDSSKIQTELGWKPQQSFEQGLQDTVRWYQNNPAWVEHVLQRQAQMAEEPEAETPPFLPGAWHMAKTAAPAL